MAELPTLGSLSYDGIDFPSNTETVRVAISPVYDKAGRTVVATTFLFVFRARFVSTSDTALTLAQLRTRLMKPAAVFIYTARGLGDLSINSATHGDLKWGPRPRVLEFKPVGGQRVADVTWQVEICLSECATTRGIGLPMEFNFRVRYERDYAGYTTRVYTGHLAIAMTRRSASDRRLTQSADYYLEKVLPEVPLGFRRRTNTADLSDDKCRLDFSVSDEQLPAPLPEGVIDLQASHTIENLDEFGLMKWQGVIDASYELSPDVPRGACAQHFFGVLVQDRVAQALQKDRKTPVGSIVPTKIVCREPEIFGRRAASFTFVYRVTTPIQELLMDGLWRPVPGTSWARWRKSLEQTAFHPRGHARMAFNPQEDYIIDLCLTTPPLLPPTRVTPPAKRKPPFPGGVLKTKCPPPELSWLSYECTLLWEEATDIVEHKPLPGTVTLKARGGADLVFKPSQPRPQTQFEEKVNEIQANIALPQPLVQQRANSSWYVTLIGKAERVCYEIPMPGLVTVAGVRVIPNNPPTGNGYGFWTKTAGNAGVPIYEARWKLRYLVPARPKGTLTSPPNPVTPTTTRVLKTPPLSTLDLPELD